MRTAEDIKNSKLIPLFWVAVLCLGLGVSTVAEDSPVYSNKNDNDGINHLFDKGDGRYLYVTPSQGQYNTPHQQKQSGGSRQKIVVKRKPKPDFYESRKPTRKGVSFSRMATQVRRTKKEPTKNKRSFSTFSEQLRRK